MRSQDNTGQRQNLGNDEVFSEAFLMQVFENIINNCKNPVQLAREMSQSVSGYLPDVKRALISNIYTLWRDNIH